VRIEVWSDIICPWCGLGLHRLRLAMKRVTGVAAGEAQLVYRSFQLDERAPAGRTETVRRMLARKFGASDAQIERMTRQIETMAEAEGLMPYHVLDNRVGNTSLAHELAAWATEQGQGVAMWELLFRMYFGDAQSIFEVEALAPLAERVGLDPAAAREALTSRRFAEQVSADGREAQRLGASGVPRLRRRSQARRGGCPARRGDGRVARGCGRCGLNRARAAGPQRRCTETATSGGFFRVCSTTQ
jgi:predicted DsbA family dithiol-disulfide isomerase